MPLRKVRDAYYISTLEVLYNGILLDACSPVTGSVTLCWAHLQQIMLGSSTAVTITSWKATKALAFVRLLLPLHNPRHW